MNWTMHTQLCPNWADDSLSSKNCYAFTSEGLGILWTARFERTVLPTNYQECIIYSWSRNIFSWYLVAKRTRSKYAQALSECPYKTKIGASLAFIPRFVWNFLLYLVAEVKSKMECYDVFETPSIINWLLIVIHDSYRKVNTVKSRWPNSVFLEILNLKFSQLHQNELHHANTTLSQLSKNCYAFTSKCMSVHSETWCKFSFNAKAYVWKVLLYLITTVKS
jgi:hypothetical protein